MAANFLLNRAKALVFIVLGIFRRAFCCFRRRKHINDEITVTLTAVGVVPSGGFDENKEVELQNWNLWEDGPCSVVTDKDQEPTTIQQHIELYRQRKTELEGEPEARNFFEDMTPKLSRQTKVLIKNQEVNNTQSSSRLEMAADPASFVSSELEVWEETGWEDQAEEELNPQDAFREKRRLDRERRLIEQQKKKQCKDQNRLSHSYTLGSKLR